MLREFDRQTECDSDGHSDPIQGQCELPATDAQNTPKKVGMTVWRKCEQEEVKIAHLLTQLLS